MRKTVDILGILIDDVTMEIVIQKIEAMLTSDRMHLIFTPNSEMIVASRKDTDLKKILNTADLLVPDGAGVVIASKILGSRLKERVAGIDLMSNIFNIDLGRRLNIFLLGSSQEVVKLASDNIEKKYTNVTITGYRNGYFSQEEESDVISRINQSNVDILMVALGSPKQEKWIYENKNLLKSKVCMGIGGSLDVFSGKTNRAPEFFQKHGLEWLYRLYKQPKRFFRMTALPKFILLVIAKRVSEFF